jgi:hypothetical protein
MITFGMVNGDDAVQEIEGVQRDRSLQSNSNESSYIIQRVGGGCQVPIHVLLAKTLNQGADNPIEVSSPPAFLKHWKGSLEVVAFQRPSCPVESIMNPTTI